jgi:hypothetical protein
MVGALGPLFRTAGHTVRTQHDVTASAGQRRGDVEIRNYLQGAAGRRSLVFDLSMTHDRFGSSSHVMMMMLVLDSVTSTPQWISQPRPRVYLTEGTYHTRLFRGPSTNDMKK